MKTSFVKELKKLPSKTQVSVLKVLQALRDSETLETSGVDLTKMEGQKKEENYYRIRVGEYRMGIEYVNPDLLLLRIIKRGDMYKYFPPK